MCTIKRILFPSIYILIIPFLISTKVCCQNSDSILINKILKNIAADQIITDGEFKKGMFMSFREGGGFPHNRQPDNNIYYTAITAFTLQNLLPQLSEENKIIAKQIISNSKNSFKYYQNKNGNPFYSFWQTEGEYLPNSYFIKYLKRWLNLGEDADDTVMILMALQSNDSICQTVKKRMIEVSNLSNKKIHSTYRKYRNYNAYSTYLGFKMPVDFDFGVHCNLLYFNYESKLPFVKQDSATILLIAKMLSNRDYMKSPAFISPYYTKTSILLYHISRLMNKFTIAEFEPYRAQLIKDTKLKLNESKNLMERVILCTSLLRLGEAPKDFVIDLNEIRDEKKNRFCFFPANGSYSFYIPLKKIFLHHPYFSCYWYCTAYDETLVLEYLIEKNKLITNKKIIFENSEK